MPRTPVSTTLRALLLGIVALVAFGRPAQAQLCQDTQVYIDENTRTNYSLGYENFRNEDYCAALPYLRWIVEHDPLFNSQGTPDDRNFDRLAETYEHLAGMTDDPALRRAYLDSTLATREAGIEAMEANDIAYNPQAELIRKGLFFAQHYNEYPERQDEVFDLYLEAFRMAPDSTDDYYLNEIGRLASTRAAAEQMDPRDARELVTELMAHADDPTYLENLVGTFRVDPIDQWAYLLEEYQGGDRSDDTIKSLLVWTVRLDTVITQARPEFDRDALIEELFPLVVEMDPTPSTLEVLGRRRIGQGRIEEGVEYLQRAIEMSEDATQKRDLYYALANALYREGQRGDAYRYAGQALDLDGNFGPALYIRALVVAGTVSNASVESRAAYWCVADLFSRAAAAGGETAGSARQLAGRYAAAGPSREDYIFLGWRPGQRVSTSHGYGSCTTTVR